MHSSQSTNRENFNFIGTSIEENENRRVDNQKFVPAWRQEVRDERGRRRFHGAFTGGFSAGYFNSVGSKEGWKPSEAGSREAIQKAAARKPEDFMDEEDLEDIRQSKETVAIYDVESSSREAQRQALVSHPNAIGFAPDSLIDLFLEQPKDSIGVTILKEMGWKPGYGIGPRKPQKDPLDVYGSYNTVSYAKKKILVPPSDIPLIDFKPLNKSQGLNLEVDPRTAQTQATKNNLNSYLSLSQVSSMQDPYDEPKINNYSSAIVELDDDGDCIVLQRRKRRPPPGSFVSFPVNPTVPNFPLVHNLVCHDGRPPLPSFVLAAVAYQETWVPPLTVPSDFIPVHKFNDPIVAPNIVQPQTVPSGTRGQLLGETQTQRSIFDFLSERGKERLSQFSTIAQTVSTKKNIPASDSALDLQLVLQHAMLDVTSAQAALRGFTPFGDNLAKQTRYRQLLQFFSKESASPPIWPEECSLDFKIQEIKDFQKAAQLFRPLSQVMASKFVSASDITTETHPQLSPGLTMVPAKSKSTPKQIIAELSNTPADFGMFGRLTRSIDTFIPARLLCKRFGVPEPQVEIIPENEKKTTNSRPPVNYQSTTAAAQKPTLDPSHFMSHFTNDQKEDKAVTPDSPQTPKEMTRPPTSLFLAVFGSNSDSE